MLIRRSYFKLTLHKSLQPLPSTFLFSSLLTEKMLFTETLFLIRRENDSNQTRLSKLQTVKRKLGNCILAHSFISILISEKEIFLFSSNSLLIHLSFLLKAFTSHFFLILYPQHKSFLRFQSWHGMCPGFSHVLSLSPSDSASLLFSQLLT